MPDKDQKKAEIIDLMAHATKKRGTPSNTGGTTVKGNNNIVATGNARIHNGDIIQKKQVVNKLQPGPQHITSSQAKQIKDLVDALVDRANPDPADRKRLYSMWYGKIKNRYDTNSYLTIPRELGDSAITWLSQQKAIIIRQQVKKAPAGSMRKDRYGSIWARAKQLGISKGGVYHIVQDRLGLTVASLKSLSDQNLERLYNIIMSMSQK